MHYCSVLLFYDDLVNEEAMQSMIMQMSPHDVTAAAVDDTLQAMMDTFAVVQWQCGPQTGAPALDFEAFLEAWRWMGGPSLTQPRAKCDEPPASKR
jgi:hypothetical protein